MTKDQFDQMHRSIVVLACTLNVLSITLIEYLSNWSNLSVLLHVDVLSLKFAVVNLGIWLAPAAAVILLRKYVGVAELYAIVLLPICLRCIYIALPRWMTAYEGLYQKGDWAHWALTLVGTMSLLVIAGWLLVQATIFLQHVANRRRKARLQTELKD